MNKLLDPRDLPAHQHVISILSPLTGRAFPLDRSSIRAMRSRLLGEGCVIELSGSTIRSPFNGEVQRIDVAQRRLYLRSSQGIQLMIQVGGEFERYHGVGIQFLHQAGSAIKAGQSLANLNLIKLREQSQDLQSYVTIVNSDKLLGVVGHWHAHKAGEDLLMQLYI